MYTKLGLLTLSLGLIAGLAGADNSGAPTLNEREQTILSNYAFKLAIGKRKELQQFKDNKQFDISDTSTEFTAAKAKVDALMKSAIVEKSGVASNFQASGIDRTSINETRMTTWNVNYGQDMDQISDLFTPSADSKLKLTNDRAKKELAALQQSDILFLNEADKGVCRSGNKDTTKELADATGMNAVYGPEFFEAEPFYHGDTAVDVDSKSVAAACAKTGANGTDHSNLTGNAILSRFPISNVRNVELPHGYVSRNGMPAVKEKKDLFHLLGWIEHKLTGKDVVDCHDWLTDEAKEPHHPDLVIKYAAEKFFGDDGLRRQLRYGSRHALIADITLPDGKVVTAVNVHTELRAKASCRRAQMAYLFNYLKDVKNPIIFAGDMNTTNQNGQSRRTYKTLLKAVIGSTVGSVSFYQRLGLYSLPTGVGPGFTVGKAAFTFLTTHRNPTRTDIPWLRPDKDGKLFKDMQKEGILWDNCDAYYSTDGKDHGPWSCTNSRDARIGFPATEYLDKTYGPIGEARLDWIFFKPDQSRELMPRYPRTLEGLFHSIGKENFPSDHLPITVMFEEKQQPQQQQASEQTEAQEQQQ